MKISFKNKFFFLVFLISTLACLFYVIAADHAEAPGATADQPADLADIYVWHEGNKLTTIVTFAGLAAPITNQAGNYDKDVLYQVHIDNDDDNVEDISIEVRFGQNANNDWGIEVKNLPGVSETVSGPVETVLSATSDLRVYAGLRDDPFFFDSEGFRQTLTTGDSSFDPDRDSFAASNTTAIVLEMDLAAASSNSNKLNIWATTGRK